MRKAVAQAIGEKSFLFCTFLGSLLNYRSPAMFLLRSPPLSEMSVDTFLSSLSVCRSPVSVVDLSLLIFFLPLLFSPLWMTRFPTDTVFLILTSSKPLLLILALLLLHASCPRHSDPYVGTFCLCCSLLRCSQDGSAPPHVPARSKLLMAQP